MPDLEEITVGQDTMTDIEVQIVDANNVVKDITGWTVKLFIEGSASGDRPASAGSKVTAANDCTIAVDSDQLTRGAGSFVTDGFVVGMLLIGIAGIPEGSYCKTVAAGAITMSLKATAASTTARPQGWFGIAGQVTNGPSGQASFVGVGQYLNIGNLLSDTYVGKVRALDGSSSEIGWTNSARGRVEFKAVQP